MDFNFTEEQSMVRDTVASFLQDKYDFETRRKIVASESGWRADYWQAFAEELGILGASFSEELGGLGGGAIDNMIIMEEFGKALVIEPYLGTVVIGGGFMKHSGYAGAASVIEGIVAGTTTIAFAYAEPQGRYTWSDLKTTAKKDGSGWILNGHKAVVIGAPFASHLVVTARTGGSQREASGVSIFLIDKNLPGVVTRDYPTVDGGRASEVYFENVSIPADALIGEEGAGLPLVEKVIDEATAASLAEGVGVLRKLHEGTLDYAKQRKQFGRSIADFQVLQHRMVDMFIELEQSVSMTYMSTIKLDESDAERAKAVSAAKVRIGRALKFVGQNAIQIHGGMGMTDELAIGHYFKRGTIIEGLFGSVDQHLRRYEGLSFGAAA
ncbi:pimeloyl-CoA dehydrogenase small subunit [Caulobacter sp. D4A]|uniref:acyl-CoA dehydrogenase family protein n=1 Tax=unclassified Caulobacter TaxID=2648921 RepID=UPI000D7313BF|nr:MULTISPECIES: acyl-CoA dehydrogenase family protein [unclassified Caulobacter]PXA76919.1 pimeloyl-CoA dehydrogenase small subunit [Caulobacter sp. D4A]PXA88833.1 pimeloyl-CoA dehydrogenase small subunit [Caulobacter sp. D5]